jgi:hypothetical protein
VARDRKGVFLEVIFGSSSFAGGPSSGLHLSFLTLESDTLLGMRAGSLCSRLSSCLSS